MLWLYVAPHRSQQHQQQQQKEEGEKQGWGGWGRSSFGNCFLSLSSLSFTSCEWLDPGGAEFVLVSRTARYSVKAALLSSADHAGKGKPFPPQVQASCFSVIDADGFYNYNKSRALQHRCGFVRTPLGLSRSATERAELHRT